MFIRDLKHAHSNVIVFSAECLRIKIKDLLRGSAWAVLSTVSKYYTLSPKDELHSTYAKINVASLISVLVWFEKTTYLQIQVVQHSLPCTRSSPSISRFHSTILHLLSLGDSCYFLIFTAGPQMTRYVISHMRRHAAHLSARCQVPEWCPVFKSHYI